MNFPYLNYSVYKTCPLQYQFRFLRKDIFVPFDRRNAFIGFLLQKLVEIFYLEKWWDKKINPDGPITRMHKAVPALSQQILEAEKLKLSSLELEERLKQTHEAIPLIIKTIKAEKLLSQDVYVEREEEFKFGDDILQGRPDLWLIRDKIITELDGKGGKTIGRYVDVDQLYFYAIFIRKILGRLPHRVGFWWYRHAEIRWYPISNELVDAVLAKARLFIDGIKAEKFNPTPGQHCRLCDYRLMCDDGQRFIASRYEHCDADIPEGNFGEVSFGD